MSILTSVQCKVRPVRSFLTPARINAHRQLECVVRYAAGNGVPTCALLVPVVCLDGQWHADNTAEITTSTHRDNTVTPHPVRPLPTLGSLHRVAIELPWPDGARDALVLLMHKQIEGIGDAEFVNEMATPLSDAHSGPESPSEFPDSAQITQAVRRCLDSVQSSRLDLSIVHRAWSLATDAEVSESDNSARFVLASCQYPAGVVDGGVQAQDRIFEIGDIGPAEHSLWALAERLEKDPSVKFSVFSGDQVYVDATAGLFQATNLLDDLSFAYERMFDHKGLQRVLRNSNHSVLPMLDDHEVADNWEPVPEDSSSKGAVTQRDPVQEKMDRALPFYINLQRAMWPFPTRQLGNQLATARTLYGYEFFFADTRTERTGRWIGNWKSAQILGSGQIDALKQWIRKVADIGTPAFVVSASMLLPRPLLVRDQPALALHIDSWCGYPQSLHDVLTWLYDAEANHIVFLSGDEHLASVTTITLCCDQDPDKTVVIHSIHCPGLYAPFPFANAQPADFAAHETFCFQHQDGGHSARQFSCTVSTQFPDTGNGFVVLHPKFAGTGWSLNVETVGQNGSVFITLPLDPLGFQDKRSGEAHT